MDEGIIEPDVEVDGNFKIRLEARIKNSALIEARERLGLTQKQVAEQIGISSLTYSAAERMQYYPGLKTQEKICLFYGLSKKEVFPKELKETKPETKYSFEKSVPISHLISSFEINTRQLTYTHLEEEIDKRELKSSQEICLL